MAVGQQHASERLTGHGPVKFAMPDDRLSLVDEHAVPASDEMSVKPAAVCPVQGADTPMKSCPVQSSWK